MGVGVGSPKAGLPVSAGQVPDSPDRIPLGHLKQGQTLTQVSI